MTAEANAGAKDAAAAEALWERLKDFDLFKTFTAAEREAFLHAFQHEYGMRVRQFNPGDFIARKGEYELEVCIVLSGRVEALGDVPGQGKTVLALFNQGDFFGELAAISGAPRTADAVAAAATEIFYLPRYLMKYVEANPQARALIGEHYRIRAVGVTLLELELFEGVPEEFLRDLIPKCEIQRYELRGVPLVKQGEVGDAFYIVRDGFVQIVQEREDGTKRVLAYLRAGEYFGEMALFENGLRFASVMTAGKCELIKIGRDDFLEVCRRYPEVEQRGRAVASKRREAEQKITPEVSDLLERSGQLGMLQSDALLVMDMDLCIKCDNCVKACESLHGASRLIRKGIQLGKYLVPSACRHCDDPKCMNSCPTGAIKRRPEGEIYFQYDLCIGCGNCAIACPYDNIAMIDTPTFDAAQASKARIMNDPSFFRPYPVAAHDAAGTGLWARLFGRQQEKPQSGAPPAGAPPHVPTAFPIKCDLCDGLPFMGCVHACPTGAAIRIDPATLFQRTGAVSAGSRVRKVREGGD